MLYLIKDKQIWYCQNPEVVARNMNSPVETKKNNCNGKDFTGIFYPLETLEI